MIYFITTKMIVLVLKVNINTAQKKSKLIKEHYGLKSHQEISVGNFCEYMGISKEEFMEALKEHKALRSYW